MLSGKKRERLDHLGNGTVEMFFDGFIDLWMLLVKIGRVDCGSRNGALIEILSGSFIYLIFLCILTWMVWLVGECAELGDRTCKESCLYNWLKACYWVRKMYKIGQGHRYCLLLYIIYT